MAAKKSYRPQVFSKLSFLVKLDGIALTEKDKDRVKNEYIVLTTELILSSLRNQSKTISDISTKQ